MKLKTRIILLTISGLIGVLLFFSLLIYVFFVRVTTNAEVQLLWNRAQIILRNPEIRKPENWDQPGLLREFLVSRTMVRIIDPSGTVRSSSANDEDLLKLRAVYRTSYHTRIVPAGMVRRVYIQVPIIRQPEKKQVGVLEIAKSVHLTQGYLRMLLFTLASGMAFGIIFAVCITVLYVRWIYKPVGQLAGTMEGIERSGKFERLTGDFAGEDEFGRLGSTFNRMISRLEDNYERQRHFVEDASHELRTPLTVIQSYAGMLRRWGGADPELREEAVHAIEQEAKRLKQLVLSLLESAEGRGEGPVAVFRELDLAGLLYTTSREIERSFGRRIVVHAGAENNDETNETTEAGETDAAGTELWLEGDGEKLKQVMIILLDNAIQYSKEDIHVYLELDSAEGTAGFVVKDRGIGIAGKHIPHLFDRFYRVDQSRSRHPGGSGLGLSIAYRIVMEHRGMISVESTPGTGTRVAVTLPLIQKTASEGEAVR
ncbi:MAG: two-component system sensor histidine kinase [Paenibacillaceae bacterium]|jgi:signal transduction histidine kinase|nr:two-component system sensor histidine kinase [Paenibacillaceae bacterium]